jgi:hypothetical protein
MQQSTILAGDGMLLWTMWIMWIQNFGYLAKCEDEPTPWGAGKGRRCKGPRAVGRFSFYSFSNPWLPNFKVLQFSVTVRTTDSGTPAWASA